MQLDKFVNTLGIYLSDQFEGKVRKLTVDANFTCPNRDGTLGRGGCTFCNVDAFVKPEQELLSIDEQLNERKNELKHSNINYLAYFQAYTNTYAEISYLKKMYQQALANPDVVGLCVGTRPDCVSDEVLQLLAEFQNQGKEVWLELGLQTANNKTLKRINRGHTFEVYQNTIKKAKKYNLKVCCHLILGLPDETDLDYNNTLNKVLETGIAGIKLHPLHIVKGSIMSKQYQAGKLKTISLEDYTKNAVNLIQRTPKNIIYHRVTSHTRENILIAPKWCGNRWLGMNAITNLLHETGVQGSKINDPYVYNPKIIY